MHRERVSWGRMAAALGLASVAACSANPVVTEPAVTVLHSHAAVPVSPMGRVSAVAAQAQWWDAQRQAWLPLQVGQAVGPGDRLRVDHGRPVVIDLAGWRVLAGPMTELEFPALSAGRLQLRLSQGSVAVRVQREEVVRSLDVLTDEVRLQATAPGVIRLDRDAAGSPTTRVTALVAPVTLLHPAPVRLLAPGQRLDVAWRQGEPLVTAGPVVIDTFHRDVVALESGTSVAQPGLPEPPSAPSDPGWEVLDRHGRWEQHPEYGPVWWPIAVSPTWEPYRSGRWVWSSAGQWVWWDDSPWGWVPFQSGRWMIWRDRWVWAPRLSPPRRELLPVAPPPRHDRHPVVPLPRPDVAPIGPHPRLDHREPGDDRRMRVPRSPGSPQTAPIPQVAPSPFTAPPQPPSVGAPGGGIQPREPAPRSRVDPPRPPGEGKSSRDQDRERERQR